MSKQAYDDSLAEVERQMGCEPRNAKEKWLRRTVSWVVAAAVALLWWEYVRAR